MTNTSSYSAVRGNRSRKLVWPVVRYLLLAIALLFFVFPIFWIVSTSLKTPEEFIHSPPIYFPREPHLRHYVRGLGVSGGFESLGDSLIISIGTTALTMAIAASAAYSMARFGTGGRNFSFWILSQRMIPPVVIVLPVFILYRYVGLIDTHMGLILLYTVFNLPLAIWLSRSYFLEVPVEVEESALIDGATHLQVIRHVTFPLAAAGLSAATVFVFIFSWTEFLFALIITRRNVLPVTKLIAQFFTGQASEWGVASAVSVVATIPIVVLGLLIRKHFVRGLTMGAIK